MWCRKLLFRLAPTRNKHACAHTNCDERDSTNSDWEPRECLFLGLRCDGGCRLFGVGRLIGRRLCAS